MKGDGGGNGNNGGENDEEFHCGLIDWLVSGTATNWSNGAFESVTKRGLTFSKSLNPIYTATRPTEHYWPEQKAKRPRRRESQWSTARGHQSSLHVCSPLIAPNGDSQFEVKVCADPSFCWPINQAP